MNDDDKEEILPPLQFQNQIDSLIEKAHDDSAKNDFELARINIHEAIQTGKNAMDTLVDIATQSQHPRAFEVLAKLMDSTVSASKELLEIQKKIREISAADAPISSKAQTVNNNLFVGSTAELQRLIKDMNKENEQ